MARRPNYGVEKRQKEAQRQKKKDEKAEKKRLRKEAGSVNASGEIVEGPDTDTDEDDGSTTGQEES